MPESIPKRISVTVSETAYRRIRAEAEWRSEHEIYSVTMGRIVNDLVMKHLQPHPDEPIRHVDKTARDTTLRRQRLSFGRNRIN
jgi:hypothetical protein